MENPDGDRQKAKNSIIFSLMTGISRLLGLGRDILKAYAFGTGIYAVAFDIAFRLPNMLRNLVAEGALSHSFIPVYDRYRKLGDGEARTAAGVVFFLTLGFLSLLSFFIMVTMDLWLPFLISNPSTELTGITVSLGQLLFPYLVFISLSSIFMGILYSQNKFAGPSFGSALMNIVILVFFGLYMFLSPDKKNQIFVFSIITLLSSVVNLAFQIYLVKKSHALPDFGMVLHPGKIWDHPVRGEMWLMVLPAIFGAAVQEISQLIDIFLAMAVHDKVPGGVSALSYSHRLIQLPIGIFGVAVATASLTQLSSLFNRGEKEGFHSAMVSSINMILYLLLPATIGMFFLSDEIVEVVFQRGSFNVSSTAITGIAVRYYAVGIAAYSLQKLFMSAYFAMRRPSVPARITFFVLVANVGLSLLFLPHLYHGGLALGSSLSAILGVGVYFFLGVFYGSFVPRRKDLKVWIKIFSVNGVLGISIVFMLYLLHSYSAFQKILIIIPASITAYIAISMVFRMEEFMALYAMIRKKLTRKK